MNETIDIIVFITCLIGAPCLIYFVLNRIMWLIIIINRKKYLEESEPISKKCMDLTNELKNKEEKFNIYINKLGLDKIHMCSNSVVSNASNDEIKYLLKYSNIEKNEDDLKYLDYCIEYMDFYNDFLDEIDEFLEIACKKICFIYRMFVNVKKIPYILLGLKWQYHTFEVPLFEFQYVSPAGRSSNSYTIEITKDVLKQLQQEISKKLGKKGFSKKQRNMMTNDLREAIKKRDNYTCCLCGNSVLNEPNLLLEVDHIIPISKGGKTEANNLQTLCWRCNRLKRDK